MKVDRTKVLAALVMLHGAAAAIVCFRAVEMELTSKHVSWGDVLLIGGISAAIAALFFYAANRVYRGKRGWLTGITIVSGLVAVPELLVGLLLLAGAASGATDSYIGPLGAMGLAFGLVHAAMAWLAKSLRG